MPYQSRTSATENQALAVCRGRVYEVTLDGIVRVLPEDGDVPVDCEVLSSNANADLQPEARVIFIPAGTTEERGCVLGTIGRLASSLDETDSEAKTFTGRSIEIVADEKLVIKCGEGQISMGPDGTVIIRGQRILSRAKGMNKVKGAAVQIN
jgi:hypothetical protein